jgi:fructose-1,6-bisphosphatase
MMCNEQSAVSCCVLVSEENEDPIIVPTDKAGKHCVTFDPLNESSNIDCNVSGAIRGATAVSVL